MRHGPRIAAEPCIEAEPLVWPFRERTRRATIDRTVILTTDTLILATTPPRRGTTRRTTQASDSVLVSAGLERSGAGLAMDIPTDTPTHTRTGIRTPTHTRPPRTCVRRRTLRTWSSANNGNSHPMRLGNKADSA